MAFEIENGVLKKYIPEDGETAVGIPEGVTEIEKNAFSDCYSIVSLKIPASVTTIGVGAFGLCVNLICVNIPEGVTSIEGGTFWRCRSLASVALPEGVTSIGSNVFSGCDSLISVTIPAGVTSIEGGTFWGCKSLTNVIIPEGVTRIGTEDVIWGSGAFSGCRSLTNVHIPDGVELIGSETFAGCESLTDLTIPESVTWIGDNAFYGCRSIRLFGITFAPNGFKEKDFTNARKMIETRDFSMKISTDIKYAAAVGFWLKTADESAECFIRKSISRIMPFLIENGNADAIGKMLESGKFITKKNIDKFIASAIAHTQSGGSPEIQTMLMHYKSEVTGYKDPKAQFKL